MGDEDKRGFWQTVPGILTGIAAIVTALAGLIGVIYQHRQSDDSNKAGIVSSTSKGATSAESSAAGGTSGGEATRPGAVQGMRINLLDPANGGKVVLAPGNNWTRTILGPGHYEVLGGHKPEEAVFGFGGNREASFDTFRVLLSEARTSNLKQFELLYSDVSPDGPFQSLGTFSTRNMVNPEDPYQEFRFKPATGKFLKVRLISNHNGYDNPFEVEDFQLLGKVEK